MLPPPDQELPLSPRARRLVQRIAVIVAVACFLGLLATKAGGAASPPRSRPPEFLVSQASGSKAPASAAVTSYDRALTLPANRVEIFPKAAA